MQNFQTPKIAEVPHITSGQDVNGMKQEFDQTSNFCDISMGEMPNQLQTFMSPSNSSTSAFNTHRGANVDTVSSVVNMLKGALERKKLGTQVDKETMEGSSFSFYNSQEILVNISTNQDAANQALELPRNFHGVFPVEVHDSGNLISVKRSLELNVEGFVTQGNQIQMGTISQEPSQSESSAAAPALSTGCDGTANSGQTFSVCESSRKNIGNGTSDHASKAKGSSFYVCNCEHFLIMFSLIAYFSFPKLEAFCKLLNIFHLEQKLTFCFLNTAVIGSHATVCVLVRTPCVFRYHVHDSIFMPYSWCLQFGFFWIYFPIGL